MRRDAGLTLIELVAAMAIFALVAVMGLQSLTGMLRTRDHLAQIDTDTSELSLTLARLRNDLSATMPLLFYPPDRQPPHSALQNTNAVFSLSIGGQPDLDGSYRQHRVAWRIEPSDNTLRRHVWTTLTPADDSGLQPEVIVMQGVTGLRLRSYWPSVGWIDGLTKQGPNETPISEIDGDTSGGAPEVYSDVLPRAIEVTLATIRYGDVPMIEALR